MIPDLIQELHDDIYGVLVNDPGCKFVSVHRSRTPLEKDADGKAIVGDTKMFDELVEKALAGLEVRNGKAGLVAVVMLPDVQAMSAESPGPALRFLPVVRVVEDRLTNEGPDGTGITASRLALHIVQLLHRRSMRGSFTMFVDAERMIEEVTADGDRPAHEVHFILERSAQRLPKVDKPTGTWEGDALGLSCTTQDAVMWWSNDGSWPGPENPKSWTYDRPMINTGACVRVVAYHDDMAPSDDATFVKPAV